MDADNISRLKVLVAEDSVPMRLVMKTYLGKLGITAQFATDGREALQKIMEGQFDLVFMDVHMPEMDGTEVVAKIRETGSTIPIIAMTTGDNEAVLKKCIEYGYNNFLLKPIMKDKLFQLVEEYS
ncbi:response regulator [Maridesulfovibrio sp.]|uniref:response regulator n=1 Tax=Maridesulfovibrio sp. TaxID=2795000 RepID=UPI0029F4C1A5|nr:response regulator [Maridesulfovibrio sp.]